MKPIVIYSGPGDFTESAPIRYFRSILKESNLLNKQDKSLQIHKYNYENLDKKRDF